MAHNYVITKTNCMKKNNKGYVVATIALVFFTVVSKRTAHSGPGVHAKKTSDT
jgi:hypothetical protein